MKLVTFHKEWEERCLRHLDSLKGSGVDERWLAIGRTSLEKAFMEINRAVFRPTRIQLPEDGNGGQAQPDKGATGIEAGGLTTKAPGGRP